MNADIQIFKNERFGEVRVVEIEGKTYFAGSDVAKALGYVNPRDAIIRHCKSWGVVKHDTPINGVMQQVTYIDEGNIYRLAAKSELPGAEEFEAWIFDVVLPSIRKHGGYLTSQKIEEVLLNPDTIIQLAMTLKEERQKRLDAERLSMRQEKVIEAKTRQLDESREWYSIKRYAKEAGMNWRNINWHILKALSCELGYPVTKIFDANYGQVNIYHINAFRAYFEK
jgi:prophage antirepressor-like protein